MLITEGRSRAGEGVVTKGQDRPDRSGLVPQTFNSLSHSETGGGISGSWSFGLEARQRTVGKRSPGRGSHVDGLFWAPEEAGLGASPRQPLGRPVPPALNRGGDRGQCPAVRGPHAAQLALQIAGGGMEEERGRCGGREQRDLIDAGLRHARP